MQVEAIYDHGKLEFTVPLQLKHQKVRLMVNIPEDEIQNTEKRPPENHPAEIHQMAEKLAQQAEQLLMAPLPEDEQLPELTDKQLERIQVFQLHGDR